MINIFSWEFAGGLVIGIMIGAFIIAIFVLKYLEELFDSPAHDEELMREKMLMEGE